MYCIIILLLLLLLCCILANKDIFFSVSFIRLDKVLQTIKIDRLCIDWNL